MKIKAKLKKPLKLKLQKKKIIVEEIEVLISTPKNSFDENVFWGYIRRFAFEILIPFIKFIGKIHAPWSQKHGIKTFYPMLEKIKPFDVILSSTRGSLSNIFNRGKFKHAIIYIGKEENIPMVIEAIGSGVIKQPLIECLATKDKIVVYRCKLSNKKVNELNIKQWLNEQVGKEYDYRFNMDGKRGLEAFYCSELVYVTHKKLYFEYESKFVLKKIMGLNTVEPDDIAKAKKIYEKII